MRLGELTRADDGLLGFFVDDDFNTLHLVDKVVRDAAPTPAAAAANSASYGSAPA